MTGTIRQGFPSARDASDEAAWFGLRMTMWDLPVVARFTVEGEPMPKSRARVSTKGGKVRTYTPERTRTAEEAVGWAFRRAAPGHRPDGDTTFGIFAVFFMGNRQRRDVDNLLKTILDGLNGVAYADDSQVIEVGARKSMVLGHSEDARSEVLIYEVGDVEHTTRKCENCGQTYPAYPSQDTRRFCEAKCGQEFRRKQAERTCPVCKEPFYAPSGTGRVYCSMACKSRGAAVDVTCAQCGRDFQKPRSTVRSGRSFCDEACRADFWRGRRKVRAQGTCDDCGGPTSKKQYSRCYACALDAKRGAK